MKSVGFFMLVLIARCSFGQSGYEDSVTLQNKSVINSRFQKADSIKSALNSKVHSLQIPGDSATKDAIQKADSLKSALNSKVHTFQIPGDSMAKAAIQRADSIRDQFKSGIDSLQRDYQKTFSNIENQRNSVQRKIDSLHTLKLHTRKLSLKLDSLNDARTRKLGEFTKKATQLKAKALAGFKEVNLPPQLQEPMQKLTQGIEGYQLPGMDKLTGLQLPGVDLPRLGDFKMPEFQGMPDFGNLTQAVDAMKTLDPNQITSDLKIPEVQDMSKLTQDLNLPENLPSPLERGGGEVKDVASQAGQVNALDKAAESQMMKIDEVKDLQGELQKSAGDLSKMTGGLSEDALKEKAKAMALEEAMRNVNEAVDHFAGKEQQLQKAMQSVSKLKTKFSSVKSLAEIPKRVPNPMKGKPFIERMVPGITFQIQKTNYLLLDVNPIIRYKVTGRFTAGAGWNERLSFDGSTMNGKVRVFGPRTVAEYKWGRGFHFLLSPELLNTEIPPQLQATPEEQYRKWIFGAFVGLKKEFKVYKKIMGNTEFLYNVINAHGKSPYQDRISLRFGFEFPMKKRSVQKSVMTLPPLTK